MEQRIEGRDIYLYPLVNMPTGKTDDHSTYIAAKGISFYLHIQSGNYTHSEIEALIEGLQQILTEMPDNPF